MAKGQYIVQFKTADVDYGKMLEVEDTLIKAFAQFPSAIVDGHDGGQGKWNIYIRIKGALGGILERIEAYLKLRKVLDLAVVAREYRPSGRLEVVLPRKYAGEFSLD